MKDKIIVGASFFILISLILTGCIGGNMPHETTSISDIINNREQFLGKQVTVKGKVMANTHVLDDFIDVMFAVDNSAGMGFILLDGVDTSAFDVQPNGWIGSNGPFYFTGIVKTSEMFSAETDLYLETSYVCKA